MVSIEKIIDSVEEVFKDTISRQGSYKRFILTQESRQRNYVQARCVYAVLALKYTELTKSCIAATINKNHATIIHYAKIFKDDVRFDRELEIRYLKAEKIILKYMHHESNADLLQQIDLEIKELLNKKRRIISQQEVSTTNY